MKYNKSKVYVQLTNKIYKLSNNGIRTSNFDDKRDLLMQIKIKIKIKKY